MRHPWPKDHDVDDLFDSPSFGILWWNTERPMIDIIDESRQTAADILGVTVAQILLDEERRLRSWLTP